MESTDEVIEIDSLERRLLPGPASSDGEVDEGGVLYRASFEEMEENYIRRHVLRRDFRTRQLYVTPIPSLTRIEYAGLTRPASDDVKIQGIADPRAFRKAVLMHIGKMKMESFNRQVSNSDLPSFGPGNPPAAWFSPSRTLRNDSIPPGQLILQKLEEVGSSVKRVQTLMEEQHCQTSEL
ncbi:hypothetical protein QJS10_CPB19g01960 [Acorus calamus]|uniref:DUF7642 domain-containing protein n=1 Tax=Acorus calamus TaxID=4465 RepID=A0AAV9CKJ8_ACOCL|nr:hypothetical protein QJS10_CPB19g01960 [Acorus calamus]